MAQIREELILYDKFSNTFTSYIRKTEQAASFTKTAQRSVDQFSKSQERAAESTGFLTGKIQQLIGAYAGIKGIQTLMGLSDTIASTTARLNRMNDGLQTTAELNQMIFQSAMRSRGAYQATADMVAKLGTLAGDAFSSSSEIVAFAEQLNKQMTLSGTSNVGRDAAMLQLTQAMSSGVLRGEELNSVLEQTPMIAQTIAQYLGVSTGQMRELASEGKITAGVVKSAILSAAEETNAAFENMPLTWGQVWTSAKNIAIKAINPILNAINWLSNNLSIVGPIVLGVGASFVVFQTAANWVNICSTATNTLKAAQAALGAVMATSWGPMLITISLVIGLFYAATAAVNKFAGTSYSATSMIAGGFAWLGAQILNTFVVPVQNQLANFINFTRNMFNNLPASIAIAFLEMADTIIGYISSVAQAIETLINSIPGMEVDIVSKVNGIRNWVQTASQSVKDASGWTEYVKKMNYFDLNEAYQKGYNWAENFSINDFWGGVSGETPWSASEDYLSQIAGDTKSIKNSVSLANEDVQMLVDMAERRFVANVNLNAPAPVIQIQGQNTGNSREDTRRMLNDIAKVLQEDWSASAQQNYGFIY